MVIKAGGFQKVEYVSMNLRRLIAECLKLRIQCAKRKLGTCLVNSFTAGRLAFEGRKIEKVADLAAACLPASGFVLE